MRSFRSGRSTSAAGRAQSHGSWCTSWKCQRSAPVVISSATSELEQASSTARARRRNSPASASRAGHKRGSAPDRPSRRPSRSACRAYRSHPAQASAWPASCRSHDQKGASETASKARTTPGGTGPICSRGSIWPLFAKVLHGLPVFASSAKSRGKSDAVEMIRRGQDAWGASKQETPRHAR